MKSKHIHSTGLRSASSASKVQGSESSSRGRHVMTSQINLRNEPESDEILIVKDEVVSPKTSSKLENEFFSKEKNAAKLNLSADRRVHYNTASPLKLKGIAEST
jgi:hypothetical protein